MRFRCFENNSQIALRSRVNTMGRNCGMSSNCPNGLIGIPSCVLIGISYDLRTFGISKSFFGWNPARKRGSASFDSQVDALFRVRKGRHLARG